MHHRVGCRRAPGVIRHDQSRQQEGDRGVSGDGVAPFTTRLHTQRTQEVEEPVNRFVRLYQNAQGALRRGLHEAGYRLCHPLLVPRRALLYSTWVSGAHPTLWGRA